jgi:hypothetical protein
MLKFSKHSRKQICVCIFANNTIIEGSHSGLISIDISIASYQTLTFKAHNCRMILNLVIPKVDIAVCSPKSMGYLVGDSMAAYPFGLDESIWSISRCLVALKLIENAQVMNL